MEKILLAIDGTNLDMPSLDFACFLGRLTKSKITGIFLENLVENQKPVLKSMHGVKYLDWETDKDSPQFRDKSALINENISVFRYACERRSVKCDVHRDRGVPAREIADESRFADVVIIDAATSFNKRYEGTPTEFVKDVLKDAECPVIIAPENFDGIDEIIFTYNGTKSSAFAIKQFTYLFPMLNDRKVIILQVNEKGKWEDRDKYNFKEWLQDHYSSISFEALKGKAGEELFRYMLQRKNVFIVMGAYGRSEVSRFFRQSRANLLIQTITQPIFISHY